MDVLPLRPRVCVHFYFFIFSFSLGFAPHPLPSHPDEFGTESLFQGGQDAMQRAALAPIGRYMAGKTASLQLLEVAAGTGRLHTFVKDSWPAMRTTLSELSPYYLSEARDNIEYFEGACSRRRRSAAATRRLRRRIHSLLKSVSLIGASPVFRRVRVVCEARPRHRAHRVRAGRRREAAVRGRVVRHSAECVHVPRNVRLGCCVALFKFCFFSSMDSPDDLTPRRRPADARAAAAKEFARVIKPGGLVVVNDSMQVGDRKGMDGVFPLFPASYHEPYFMDYVNTDSACRCPQTGTREAQLLFVLLLFLADARSRSRRPFHRRRAGAGA